MKIKAIIYIYIERERVTFIFILIYIYIEYACTIYVYAFLLSLSLYPSEGDFMAPRSHYKIGDSAGIFTAIKRPFVKILVS